jgi:hypothetical protein
VSLTRHPFLALNSLALVACTRANEPARADPEVARVSATSPSASAPPVSKTPGLLPPLETACATDADCTHGWTYEIAGKCCKGGCSPDATTHAWVAKAAAICQKAGYSEKCPEKKCAAPPPVACISGQCVLGK